MKKETYQLVIQSFINHKFLDIVDLKKKKGGGEGLKPLEKLFNVVL